ncbi:nucleotidyltransferase [Halobaculum sp. WSA2]|uniref:Nucleotidyltransferase n=1 Tax=Halobaculum saliterrae TaxID=2073113 RepID=A0A6B0SP39_9EURY|nr:CBASS oligonucleotide cyclase [Halobaculum saliterrae]MXR40495.1 nucleotidyltransferase [Halobaculum saliterrae]
MMGGGFSTGHEYQTRGRGVSGQGSGAGSGTRIDTFVDEGDTVDDAYDEFAEDTTITDRQGETISARRDVIVAILEEDLSIKESQLIGSFTRGTMVGPLKQDSDADIMIVLDADEHRQWTTQRNGATNALRAVKRRIENDPRFADTEVTIDQNVVKVRYHDSTLEIAPAFDYSEVPHAEHPRDGFNLFNDASDGYAIPDTHGSDSWMGTNPRAYKNEFEARDQAHDGRVSGLTRMMKKWSDNNEVPVRSYHMEIMVHNYFAEKARTGERVPSNYHDLAMDFMQSLPDRVRSTTREPIYDEAVDGGMSREEREAAARKAESAADTLDEAAAAKERGDTATAKQRLKTEYGEGFQ